MRTCKLIDFEGSRRTVKQIIGVLFTRGELINEPESKKSLANKLNVSVGCVHNTLFEYCKENSIVIEQNKRGRKPNSSKNSRTEVIVTNEKKLPKERTKNGYLYKMIDRTDNAAIYEQIDQTIGKTVGYETFKVLHMPAYVMNGVTIEASEKFPGNEDFGKIAWSFCSLESAMNKYKEIC